MLLMSVMLSWFLLQGLIFQLQNGQFYAEPSLFDLYMISGKGPI